MATAPDCFVDRFDRKQLGSAGYKNNNLFRIQETLAVIGAIKNICLRLMAAGAKYPTEWRKSTCRFFLALFCTKTPRHAEYTILRCRYVWWHCALEFRPEAGAPSKL